MIFLPEVSRHPSMQLEASREWSLLDESLLKIKSDNEAGGIRNVVYKISLQNMRCEMVCQQIYYEVHCLAEVTASPRESLDGV